MSARAFRSSSQVRNAAIAGLALDIADVAKVDAGRGVITLRHPWADDEDGRVLSAVSRCVRAEAERIAAQTRQDVEVYAVEGHLWMTIEVSR